VVGPVSLAVVSSLLLMAPTGCDDDGASAMPDAGSTSDAAAVPDADAGAATDAGWAVADAAGSAAEPDAIVFVPPDPDTLPERPGGDRPAEFFLPEQYDPVQPWPLVVQLHGFTVNARFQEGLLRTRRSIDDLGFILLTPDGTRNGDGDQFWNAGDVCCDFEADGVDDVAYLTGLIDEAQTRWHIDSDRIYVLGHSNGGYMSYRMACEVGDRIAGIMNLAGANSQAGADCPHPVTVLHVHGTADDVVPYDGGVLGAGGGGRVTPGALESVEAWAAINGCDGVWDPQPPRDVDIVLEGAETTVQLQHECASGAPVALWTIPDGAHIPRVGEGFMREALTFLFEHARVGP
jgi:polyhydroxybutyrate depolymerase